MTPDLMPALVLLPLTAATAAAVLPAAAGRWLALAVAVLLPLALYALTRQVMGSGEVSYALAGLPVPLGIRLRLDGLSVLLLWLVCVVYFAATAHAAAGVGSGKGTRRFWAAWLMLPAGLNELLISADLFNLYVGLELLTLSAVALVAFNGTAEALRAAMRYLLLAMLAALVYLLGVALVYGATGTLDLELMHDRMGSNSLRWAALILMTGGLLLKGAVFPLHGWLPPAHSSAPGPVSAVLSALVVKAPLYILFRLWFEAQTQLPAPLAGQVLTLLGCGAVLYGSVLALRQRRLKRVIAYSTVAQLGYLMLLFGMPSVYAWQGAIYQVLSHGLAKAALFLAAANLAKRLGSDLLEKLPGADQVMPVSVFALGLAGVNLMGLPPSGGFLAKWLLLTAAWQQQAWHIVIVILLGSLLAAAYVFRVLDLIYARPAAEPAPGAGPDPGLVCGLTALLLALLAIATGFVSAPVLELLPVPAVLAEGAR
jgi:formate hydrogenlyase subunit 3/multisubunit Na+/H+ antiporter MnhD subunit